jgi:hypothetical protein
VDLTGNPTVKCRYSMRFLVDGRLYALRWYSVDRIGMALGVARAVVGAHVLSEALFSCFEFCADGFVDDTDDGRVLVGSYIVGGAVGGPVGMAWRIASG